MTTNTIMKSAVALVTICLSCAVAAQSVTGAATRKAQLENLAETLQQRDKIDKQAAQAYAQAAGIPLRRELPNGGVLELQRVRPGKAPVFYITNNLDAADTASTDEVWPGGSAGLSLNGTGLSLGLWDGGAVFPDHPDFYLNSDPTSIFRLSQVDGATTVSGHSTHVAGTLIGAGLGTYPEARGMAYASHLNAYEWNSDTAEMAAAAASGMLISNHSYGIAAGWIYLGDAPPNTWWWIGGADPADVEDPNFGYYDSESQLWDQIAYDAPNYLMVKAAGNDRSDIGPVAGEEYTVIDQDGNFLFTSTLPREPDCAPAGYDCIPGNSVAKNILTVGAVDDLNGGYSPLSGPGSVVMSPFSSWGPTDDGRIKPDLVGNGVFLLSTWPDFPYYAVAAGTSMATPNVTGSLLLLQEHYQDLHGIGNYMLGATLKAVAIHTADEAGAGLGPDFEFGWGLLNTKTAAELITDAAAGNQRIIEDSLANGGVDTHTVNVSESGSTITVTLVWMDPPGTPAPPALDPTNLMLVNDLDLLVTRDADAASFYPWVLDPANPANPATTGDNFRDNVEQVKVYNAAPGSYTVQVSHKAAALEDDIQNYSLIISVTAPPPMGSGFPIDEDFSGGLPVGWSVVTDSGVPWTFSNANNLTGGNGGYAVVQNNYSYDTRAHLRTPVLDLSAANAAVLRFKSALYFDWIETFNVDVSTDGGTGWSNVWQITGFHPYAEQYSLDLTSSIAGQSAVMLRFRFDSGGFGPAGNYWQVDDVQLELFGSEPAGNPPGTVSNPVPAVGSTAQTTDTNLSWSADPNATSHDIYFGTAPSLKGSSFQGNQTSTLFDPGTLSYSTTYYWRIDEVNAYGTTSGTTWSFTTESEPASSPPDAPQSAELSFDGWTDNGNGTVTLTWSYAGAVQLQREKWNTKRSVYQSLTTLCTGGTCGPGSYTDASGAGTFRYRLVDEAAGVEWPWEEGIVVTETGGGSGGGGQKGGGKPAK